MDQTVAQTKTIVKKEDTQKIGKRISGKVVFAILAVTVLLWIGFKFGAQVAFGVIMTPIVAIILGLILAILLVVFFIIKGVFSFLINLLRLIFIIVISSFLFWVAFQIAMEAAQHA